MISAPRLDGRLCTHASESVRDEQSSIQNRRAERKFLENRKGGRPIGEGMDPVHQRWTHFPCVPAGQEVHRTRIEGGLHRVSREAVYRISIDYLRYPDKNSSREDAGIVARNLRKRRQLGPLSKLWQCKCSTPVSALVRPHIITQSGM